MPTFRHKLATLYILAWNIYIGRSIDAVRKALRPMLDRYDPEIVALMEATKMYGHLNHMGYQVVHMKPKPRGKGHQPAEADIALLVRDDIELVKPFTMRLKEFWRGPKHGWTQDPKVYRWVLIRWGGKVWKVGCAHTPFGAAARLESRNRLVKWFRKTRIGRPTILVLDANMLLKEFEDTIADPSGAEASGHKIDLEANKNCELVYEEDLGKHGSDHVAMLYGFKA